ncbi:hypothetical protein NDU88_004321 [Pleurodeles waltl]|uniref:Uncharacterized protein n=1 Tax=Pleurodeles waltl TaxID=8319 RepID=A0AAV7PEU4_PLEWA|nr:hypothetical protein NDU88_004321 [Pleurodeles waltl]
MGHGLSFQVRDRANLHVTSEIKRSRGDVVTDPALIREEFCHFYQKLYDEEVILSMELLDQFLQPHHHRKLSTDQQLTLKRPISALEVEGAVGQLAHDKSCGPNQLPLELYSRLLHLIVLFLLDLFN